MLDIRIVLFVFSIKTYLLLLISFVPTRTLAQDIDSKVLFEQHCTTCHSLKQDGIGPNLQGLGAEVSNEYIRSMIKNAEELIQSGNERANNLYEKYGVPMPSFQHLEEKEIDALVQFLLEQNPIPAPKNIQEGYLTNPIPERIRSSDIHLEIDSVLQFPKTNEQNIWCRITKFGTHPSRGSLLALDMNGILYELVDTLVSTYFQIANLREHFINQPGLATGFGSFAFHPNFKKNGLLYTTHTESTGYQKADFSLDSLSSMMQWVLTEWQTEKPDSNFFIGGSRELFRIDMHKQIHGVQEIAFNPYALPTDEDFGLLYVGIGDGGALGEGYPYVADGNHMPWSKIFRIDPLGNNSQNGNYGIPYSNPWTEEAGALGEIFASGFRNPNRLHWTKNGKLLVANIGQKMVESLYLVSKGANAGWPYREGSFKIYPEMDINYVYPVNATSLGILPPLVEYDHDEGNAILGGFEYLGTKNPSLFGKYLFGDIVNGRLFFLDLNPITEGSKCEINEWFLHKNGKKTTLQEITKSKKVDLRMGLDAAGEILLFSKSNGVLYRLKKEQH